jgi:uncharacterized RDD family membrane protein YckC
LKLDPLAPVRAAARSSRGILADEAERAVDAVFAGPMPEAIGRSLAEHHVLERIVGEFLETIAPDGVDAKQLEELVQRATRDGALAKLAPDGDPQQLAERIVQRVTASPAFRQALKETLSSPELRAALAEQSVGAAGDLVTALRSAARKVDEALGRGPQSAYGGFGTRGIALVADAALAQLAYLVIGGSIGLVAALAGAHRGAVFGSLAGAGWVLVTALYFVVFWSGAGSTPGMRAMRLRVTTASGAPPSAARALVRFVGLLLAIAPLFAGFLPVFFDPRRRALQDYLAGTVVVYEPDPEESP